VPNLLLTVWNGRRKTLCNLYVHQYGWFHVYKVQFSIFSHSTEVLVTTAMLQDIYSVKASPASFHIMERRVRTLDLTDATFWTEGIVKSTTPVPSLSLLDLFLWILHCSFCANGNSCSTFVVSRFATKNTGILCSFPSCAGLSPSITCSA